jgi:type I restriction enzyme S subunit
MSPELLLAHFTRISDAPDAIPRLRTFVLNLAVRGKLVEQDPNDESTSELLQRIHAWRKEAEGAKNIRVPRKPLQTIGETEPPYSLPSGWEWARLGELIYIHSGDGLTAEAMRNGCIPVFGGNGIAGYHDTPNIFRPSIVIGRVGSCGSIHVTPAQAWVTDNAFVTEFPADEIFQSFLVLLLRATNLKENERATAQPVISGSKIYPIIVGLPPLAEQHRIVAKVDELMALCDRLEAARAEREGRQDRLTAASHHHLINGADAGTFRKHANFYINHLPSLTSRPDQIKQLPETILNLAVRGKLVPQDPNDESASDLLKRILTEKAQLMKKGEIRKQKTLPLIDKSTAPFNLPNGWCWTRLGSLSRLVTSGSRDWAKFYSNDGAIFVRMGNLSRDSYQLRLGSIQRVKPPADSEGARTRLEEGDILISITGEVGLLGLIPRNFGESYINQHTCLVRPMECLRNRYLPELFRSPFAQNQFDEPQRGLKNSLRLTYVTQFLVPLHSLAEQLRIVAKVDELMALCDRLEAAQAERESRRDRLAAVSLHRLNQPSSMPPRTKTVACSKPFFIDLWTNHCKQKVNFRCSGVANGPLKVRCAQCACELI